MSTKQLLALTMAELDHFAERMAGECGKSSCSCKPRDTVLIEHDGWAFSVDRKDHCAVIYATIDEMKSMVGDGYDAAVNHEWTGQVHCMHGSFWH